MLEWVLGTLSAFCGFLEKKKEYVWRLLVLLVCMFWGNMCHVNVNVFAKVFTMF